MDPREFCARLGELAPAKAKLLSVGYDDAGAEEFIASFQCIPREVPLDTETHGDPLLELMAGWDISRVEIGPLCFLSEPVALSESYVEVGSMESDKLVFRMKTKDFVVLDHEVTDRVSCKVSADGGSLLDALLCIRGYYAKTAIDEIDIDDEPEALKVKAECVSRLGGDEFEGFCTSLLGV